PAAAGRGSRLRLSVLVRVGQEAFGGEPDPGADPVALDRVAHIGWYLSRLDYLDRSLGDHRDVDWVISFRDHQREPGSAAHVAFADGAGHRRQPEDRAAPVIQGHRRVRPAVLAPRTHYGELTPIQI